jgi:hypothetical protein
MKYILALLMLISFTVSHAKENKMKEPEKTTLKINGGNDWYFMNGAWKDGDNNLLDVPGELHRADGPNIQGHHYAFNKKLAYKDVRVRFEFRLTGHTDAGIILRAADESHFYLLHFPNCGQAWRAQHFWAAFSKMDDSGYLKRIKMDMVRRVPSTKDIWLAAEVTLAGNKISVHIGENGYFEAVDDTYPNAGHVGVFSFGAANIRNVTFEGQPASAAWNDKIKQPVNWFYPCPDTQYGKWQQPADLLCLPDGELILNFTADKKSYLIRSRDKGKTWSKPEELKIIPGNKEYQPPRLHLTPAGRLICLIRQDEKFLFAESKDAGRTWSEPVVAPIPVPPHMTGLHAGPQAFLNLKDKSMVMFLYGGHDLKNPDYTVFTWGSLHCQAYACRSEDDGRTWSAPVNVDNPGSDDKGKMYDGNLDLTEVCGAQMSDGRIMALIRPIYSPWMWETWSSNGGKTWGPCVRGPFPGYATPNMLRTASGALLVAHRLPSLTIHCGWEDGRTWDEGTLIDSGLWVMGSMVEVEPDVVLYIYWDSFESRMRGQFFKVTRKGLEPVRK